MKPLTTVVYFLLIRLPLAATAEAETDEINLARPVSTTAKPTLPTSYFNSPCKQSGTGYITCGKEFCESAAGYVTSFRSPASEYSYSYSYNLSAYIQFYGPGFGYCVDHYILNNPNSGYGLNELDGVAFAGILKIREPMSNNVYYVPFKTELKAKANNNARKAVYDMPISRLWDVTATPLKDSTYPVLAMSWLAFRRTLNSVIRTQEHNSPNLEKVRLPRSDLTLTLTHSWTLWGKVYDASLTGQIKTPFNNSISARFNAVAIRFAKPGFNNFRKDYRYTRSVSMLPDIREYYKIIEEPHQVIEVVLIPGEAEK